MIFKHGEVLRVVLYVLNYSHILKKLPGNKNNIHKNIPHFNKIFCYHKNYAFIACIIHMNGAVGIQYIFNEFL